MSKLQIEELIARLEKATGPDRELDAEIHWFLHGHKSDAEGLAAYKRLGAAAAVYDELALQSNWRAYDRSFVPRFTESIDAALTLVPEGYSFDVVMQPWRSSTPKCSANVWSGLSFNAMAETPAIALCIAALKAITAGDKQ
jgi:hypothetical protein